MYVNGLDKVFNFIAPGAAPFVSPWVILPHPIHHNKLNLELHPVAGTWDIEFTRSSANEIDKINNGNPGLLINEGVWTPGSVAAGLPEIADLTVSTKATYGVGEWVEIFSANDATLFSFWFDTTGSDSAPAAPGTLRRVDISADVSANDVAVSLATVINQQPDFTAPAPGAAIVTVTNTATGVTTDADASNSAATGSVTTQQGTDTVPGAQLFTDYITAFRVKMTSGAGGETAKVVAKTF